MDDTQKNILKKFNNTNLFYPYINSIRFPEYKSVLEDTKITFDWPIVALVGPNGTNKSSILQAISSAPAGRSLAEFWFSTAVDDIDKSFQKKSGGQRFIYEYSFDSNGTKAECRKYRGNKPYRGSSVPKALANKTDPDYWEPTKRVAYDDMRDIPPSGYDHLISKNRDRWNQIQKEVVYLDFRAELSAFDKYIHHQSYNRWSQDDTQKRHRAVIMSRSIAKALNGEALNKRESAKIVEEVRDLTDEQVRDIGCILGKDLKEVKILEHKIFGPQGSTVRMFLEGSAGNHYSEAHAGSGEYSVVKLVDAITRAPERSLILLDEPEVSLHPGAQIELLRFIERQVLKHGHQVVFTTHSPALISNLPNQAIKVLGFDRDRHKVVVVADGCSSTEAFTHLGQVTATPETFRLIVEDELAVQLTKAALRRRFPAALSSLEVVAFPGGAGGIVKNVLPSLALSGATNISILIDGDQEPQEPRPRPAKEYVKKKILDALDEGDKEYVEDLWRQHIHAAFPKLFLNSDESNLPESLAKCIDWAYEHLATLPWCGMNPEQAIAISGDSKLRRSCSQYGPQDWKQYWRSKVIKTMHLTEKEQEEIDDAVYNLQVHSINELPDTSPIFDHIHDEVIRLFEW